MTSRDFCYWFQGWLEIEQPKMITKEQVVVIQKHLNLVFKHEIDPSMGDAKKQDALNKMHGSTRPGELVARC